MHLPAEPRPGQKLEAGWGAAVIRYLRSITPRTSVECIVNRTPNGTSFRPRAVGRTTTAAASGHPFKVVAADEGFISVIPGAVDGFIPLLGGTPLDDDPAPQLAIPSNGRIYLKVTVSTGDVVSAEIIFSAIALTNTLTVGYLWLASITSFTTVPTTSFKIVQLVSGSQAYQQCNTSHLFGLV